MVVNGEYYDKTEENIYSKHIYSSRSICNTFVSLCNQWHYIYNSGCPYGSSFLCTAYSFLLQGGKSSPRKTQSRKKTEYPQKTAFRCQRQQRKAYCGIIKSADKRIRLSFLRAEYKGAQ